MNFTRLLPVAAVVMLAAHAIPNIARALPGQPFQALRNSSRNTGLRAGAR